MDLVEQVYVITNRLPQDEKFGLTNQLRRAAVSIPSNIAEGAARKSDKEFIQFLYVSLGSIAEIETQLLISERLKYIEECGIIEEVAKVRKPIIGLINYLKNKSKS